MRAQSTYMLFSNLGRHSLAGVRRLTSRLFSFGRLKPCCVPAGRDAPRVEGALGERPAGHRGEPAADEAGAGSEGQAGRDGGSASPERWEEMFIAQVQTVCL